MADQIIGIGEPGSEKMKACDNPFEPGQIVCLKSSRQTKGAVVGVTPGHPEARIKVFIGDQIQAYYASQLVPVDESEEEFHWLPIDNFHAYLTAIQIQYPGLSTLYSLNAARINFIPYQFRPVLKFIRSDRPRFLLADSVGVGKTIEAGLILRELQARRQIDSILIICPRPLVVERKWEIEMKRFDERFIHLDGSALRYCLREADLEGEWPQEYNKAIIPFSLFDEALLLGTQNTGKGKKHKGLLNLHPPPQFDLVIVDEAHHIRNQDTYSYKAVRLFCDYAEAVLFLTATPIQLRNQDLFVLLNTLRPDLVIDEQSFSHMSGPNPHINKALSMLRSQADNWVSEAVDALDLAEATPWGKAVLKNNPEFQRVRSDIASDSMSPQDRVRLITDLEGLHTFSGMLSRTRRRDIGEFTVRKPETVVVEFTPAQKMLHDELLDLQAAMLGEMHGNKSVNFMMTTLRRQAASCLYGLVPFLETILKRHVSEIVWDEADSTEENPAEVDPSFASRISGVLEKVQDLDPRDPKRDSLVRIIQRKLTLPNNKVIVFSSFRHTLYYLHDHLMARGMRVGLIHGETPDDERVEMRNRFASHKDAPQAFDVMLFSEIGCEGLDYQFCDCIVNYDLPWNPMRIEQRIGRIDRNGQQSPTVAIINLITPGTVDADIYERCLMRIGVFNSSLGCTEDILGDITQEIRNIAENFSLNEEERKLQLQQLADNKIRLIQEQESLEQKQLELLGIRLPTEQMRKEVEDASSYWLSPNSIQRMVTEYLHQVSGRDQEFFIGEGTAKKLRLSQAARQNLLNDLRKIPRQRSSTFREWEKWLQGGHPFLSVVFDARAASEHPEAVFLNLIHPLVRQAAASFERGKRILTSVKVKADDMPPGKHQFVLYIWQYKGIREEIVLRPVASSEIVTQRLSQLLEEAEPVGDSSCVEDSKVWADLDSYHYRLWSDAKRKHRAQNREMVEFKTESLAKSHQARLALLTDQLRQASNEKIRRMRQSQIASAEADHARRMNELEMAMETADITFAPIAWGVIEIG